MIKILKILILVVVVVEGNIIKNTMIDIGEDLGEQELLNLNILLNSSLNGLTIEEINLGIISKLKEDAGIHSKVIELVLNEVAEAIKAGGEDLQIKGLGEQVVAPQLHGHHGVDAVSGGGQEQDGDLGDPADLLTPVVAVEKRQGDIQQHQLRVKSGKVRQHIVEAYRAGHLISPALQMPLHGAGDDGIVFHRKNSVHW